MLVVDTRFELGINLQDVVTNPRVHDVMQVPEQLEVEALYLAQPFVIADKATELFVLLPILIMRGTPVHVHAVFLGFEMSLGVGFEVIDQIHSECQLLLRGIGGVQLLCEKIDVVDQQAVLLVELRRTSLKVFCPNNHI